jgi:hypothetical protein
LELYGDLHKAALLGGDRITSWGKGMGKNRFWISGVSVLLYTVVTKLTEILGQHIVMITRINIMAKKVKQVFTILELNGVYPKLRTGAHSLFLCFGTILGIT